MAEIGLRVVGFSSPSFYTTDPDLGWITRPGAAGWQRAEGEAYVRINSEGFRDREHAAPKPPGTLRVAVVGDSFTTAIQVPAEVRFTSVMENRLSMCPALGGRKVEVFNFGVGRYGTAQELLTLRTRVWKYSPDIVVLCFCTGNDVRNNYHTLNEDPSLQEGSGAGINSCPYFVYKGDKLVLDNSFRSSPRFQPRAVWLHDLEADILNKFRLLQLVNNISNLATWRAQQRAAQKRLSDPARLQKVFGAGTDQTHKNIEAVDECELGLDNLVYYSPTTDAWKEAWRVTKGLLVMTRDEVRDHGAQFLLMIGSTGRQVNPDLAVRKTFMKSLGVDTLLYPDTRLQAFAEKENIPVVALAPIFAAYTEQHHVSVHGFKNSRGGHWNELGHRLAGEIVASRICDSMIH